ncbi:MAG: diguanylate cyclase [Butyricicoccus sp.]|nr:diguanylate cyclase [Butyricicoccus sp.]
MTGYSWVAVISISCYAFLLMTFVASKKKDKVIQTFIALLAIMILWNGGSFGMRMQFWPDVNFWHHVSLFGMMMLPVGYFQFVLDFLEERSGHFRRVWLLFYIGLFVFNYLTGFFIPLPEVVMDGGKAQFLYHYSWTIVLMFVPILLTLVQLGFIIRRHCLGNQIAFQQLKPVIYGIMAMLIGHMLTTLPIFVGLPVDMLSGAINALFLFYALYKKRLFRMTLLLSRSNYFIISMVLGAAIFSNFALSLQRFLMNEVGVEYTVSMIIIAVMLLVMIALLFFVITASLDAIFVRTEQQQTEMIARFGEDITHMMSVDDILLGLSETVQKAVGTSHIFVFVRGLDGDYRIEHTTNPLEEKSFILRADHPLITFCKAHPNCALLRDFSRSTIYRSMWEVEKSMLTKLQIECFAPLISEDDLVGVVMLTGKQNKSIYQPNDFSFLQSISSICAMAVKNAYAYEKAVEEARKDDLTRLVNRKFFFELLDREFERYKDTALSLCLFSLDDFKLYNQLYGTHEGDIALQRVAGILNAGISDHCYAARIGGKEFALILPGYDIYSAKCLAENISSQINDINAAGSSQTPSKLTVSVGICAAPYMASTAKELFRNADTAVYTVKRTGKNAVLIYSAEIYRRETTRTQHKSGYSEHASTIYALTAAIDAKDHYTFRHSRNVAHYAGALAAAAGMSPDLVEIVKEAGLLHDIGKIGVREDILNKPGRLTMDEYEVMKSHVENAVNIIRYLPSLDYAIPAVLSHHERYDGNGYPRKLAGEEIPIMGRILCIADAFDAITSIRSYKDATPPDEAIKILRAESGKQFDPNLVEIFASLVEDGKLELHNVSAPSVPLPPEAAALMPI